MGPRNSAKAVVVGWLGKTGRWRDRGLHLCCLSQQLVFYDVANIGAEGSFNRDFCEIVKTALAIRRSG